MRRIHHNQLRLVPRLLAHPHAREMEAIADLLDRHPTIAELATQDLVPPGVDPDRGRTGMTGEQVVRAAVLKQMRGFSYVELAFHLLDSTTYRRFCRIGVGDTPPGHTTLQDNIRRLKETTWRAINQIIVGESIALGIERGDKARIDATVTETNIHEPDDAAQLWDVVRTLTRLMSQASEAGLPVVFHRRTRRAKRRRMDVLNAKRRRERRAGYRDLVNVTEEVLDMAEAAVRVLAREAGPEALDYARQLLHFAALGRRVVDQTRRRVFDGEKVPSREKVVSIFEPHTDIIVKGKRKVQYGHKMFISAGASSIVFDLLITRGNPNDSTLANKMVARTAETTGRVPRQVTMDGGFASKANLVGIKAQGVKDVCFSKGRSLEIADMVKSAWVYKRLRRFRAGVEATISYLKRVFGLDRCTWRGEDGFARYAWASVVACNLLVIARHLVT